MSDSSDLKSLYDERAVSELFSTGTTVAHEGVAYPTGRVATEVFEPGAIINGRYRVDELLGLGGMGAVFRVADTLNDDRQLALKTLADIGREDALLGLFKAEFRVMTTLRHPNVADVFDFERIGTSSDCFFTMELVRGSSPRVAIESGNWRGVVDLLVQVSRALSYMHSRNVIHFDLKPGNILVDAQGRVKVLDFGIAAGRPADGTSHRSGTPAYMAPELLANDTSIDHRVDFYSLGIMAFELLCKRLPFHASNAAELARMHREEPVRFGEGVEAEIPLWLRELVAKLAAKAPSDRFRTANEIIREINRGAGLTYELETRDTRESYVFSTPIIGRSSELGVATEFLENRRTSRGAPALLVAGRSGFGKSRLMREVRHQAQLLGVPLVESDCYENAHTGYEPLVDILRPLVRFVRTTPAEWLVARCGPELAKLDSRLRIETGCEPSRPLENHDAERLRLLDTIAEFCIGVARSQPCALFVNDVQWLSEAAAEVLVRLIERVDIEQRTELGAPLALFLSVRDDEVEGRPIEGLIRSSTERMRRVSVAPLGPKDVHDFICAALGIPRVPEEFVTRVREATGGNPFLIEEVLRVLVERGDLLLNDEQALQTAPQLGPTESAGAVFLRRAALLGDNERLLLDLLAVAGRPTETGAIAKAVALSPDTMHSALAELARRQMVRIVSGGDRVLYSVRHDRMREALYGDLSADRRRRAHSRVGEALEATATERGGAEREDVAGLLSYHYSRAEDWLRAVVNADIAAQRLRATGRVHEALTSVIEASEWVGRIPDPALRKQWTVSWLKRRIALNEHTGQRREQLELIAQLLSMLAPDDSAARVEALIQRGDALTGLGQFADAETTLEEALSLAKGRNDAKSIAQVHRAKAFVAWQKDQFAQAAEHNGRAAEMALASNDREAWVRDTYNQATCLLRLDEDARVVECTASMERVAGEEDDVVARHLFHHLTALRHRRHHEYEPAIHHFRRSIEVLEDDPARVQSYAATLTAAGLRLIAGVFLEAGKIDESLATYREQIATSRRSHLAHELVMGEMTVADLLVSLGRDADAVPHLREAAEVWARVKQRREEAAVLAKLGTTYRRLGQTEESLAAWRAALRLVQSIGERRGEADAHEAIGQLLRARDRSEAIAHYEAALSLIEAGTDAQRVAVLNHALGNVLWELSRFEDALGRFRVAAEIFARLRDDPNRGATLNCVGAVLRGLGRRDEAIATLQEALPLHRANQNTRLLADALTVLGHARRESGNPAGAVEAFREALVIREQLGDITGQAWASHHLAHSALDIGDLRTANELAARAMELSGTTSDSRLRESANALMTRVRTAASITRN